MVPYSVISQNALGTTIEFDDDIRKYHLAPGQRWIPYILYPPDVPRHPYSVGDIVTVLPLLRHYNE